MTKLSFYAPENDLFLRMARLLVLLKNFSPKKGKSLVLTVDKLAVFDFLLRYPSVLYRMNELTNAKLFTVIESESSTVEAEYPNSGLLNNYDRVHEILLILLCYQFVNAHVDDKDVYYVVSDEGKEFVDGLDSDYIKRADELCTYLAVHRSARVSKIKALILSCI